MGDVAFPARLKPIVNRGYDFRRGSNVKQIGVSGGLSRSALQFSREPVPFNINLLVTTLGQQAFFDWYDSGINHGANTFPMELDSGNGLETHQCLITNGPSISSIDQKNWAITLEITAESNPSQDAPFSSALFPLWDAYGDELYNVLNQYAILATEDLPI